MARLPRPGSDAGEWGGILNDFLAQAHTSDGSLRPDSVSGVHIKAGSITAAMLQTTSGPNGIAVLDSQGTLPSNQLPQHIQPQVLQASIVASHDQRAWLATDHGILVSSQSSDGQEVAINAACQALSSLGGGVLIIPKGTEILVTDAIRGADNVTICLESGSRIRKNNPDTPLMFSFNGCTNFAIIGSGIIDFGPRTVTAGVSPVHSMRFTNCRNVRVEGLTFVNCSARVISLQGTSGGTGGIIGCDGVTIANCRFEQVIDIGIDIQTGFPSAAARNISITNNVFESVKKQTVTSDPNNITPWTAIYAKAYTLTISGNHFKQSDDTAIMLGNGCDDFIIESNRCATQQVSLFLGGVSNGIIKGNKFTSSNDMGIHYFPKDTAILEGSLLISDNIFTDCAKSALFIEGGSEVVIASNIFKHCTWNANAYLDERYKATISVAGSGTVTPNAITITNNQIIQGTTAASTLYGISIVNSPTNIVVSGNQVIGSGYTTKYRYIGLSSELWEVQTDASQTYSNKRILLPRYEELAVNTPSAGAKCWHVSEGELYGDGSNWRRTRDGALAGV